MIRFLYGTGTGCGLFCMGTSASRTQKGLPVSGLMWNAMGKTAMVAVSALAISLIISIPLGIWTAVKKNTVVDYLVRFLTFLANAIPSFLAALLLIYLFCVSFQWLPVLAKNSFQGLILPTVALAMPTIGKFIKQIRADGTW